MTALQFLSTYQSPDARCKVADQEAAARYRKLAADNSSLRRDYLKRAAECDRIAAMQPDQHNEADIPAEWRQEVPEGAILREFTREESDAVELDRR